MNSLFITTTTAETEVNFTPNEADTAEDGSGALPQSTKMRQQLLQLEQVIMSSPNPEQTLQQAAEANNMSPQELANMLQRNRQDLEQSGEMMGSGGGQRGGIVASTLKKIVTTVALLISKSATHNPKVFALVTTTLLLMALIAFSAPRTGLVISNSRGLLSKGPTTIWNPPTKYLDKVLSSSSWRQMNPQSGDLPSRIWDDELALKEDGVVWHSLSRKSSIAKAASARVTISPTSFIDNEEDDEVDDDQIDFILNTCYNAAADILSTRQITEYAPDQQVKLHTLIKNEEGRRRFGMLVVKKAGDWNRFGLIPIQVTRQNESDDLISLTYSTLKGSHFAGQIHISIQKQQPSKRSKKKVADIVVQVSVAMPKKAPRISKKIALSIVESISQSMTASIQTRTRQSLARKQQSSKFQGSAHKRATERRHSRFKKEKEMEDMAADRRRKWQRNNPNSGRYRPSGDRMRSPNNC